ncbi:MAG: Ppx/GppA family phosphatase [Verrucomicrobiota bacterium]|nr:Ppx/GppA family phosphatase [Verrucomicrobiota bacterium]
MSPTVIDQTKNRRAVIDVGSNSVKLLVADVTDDAIIPLIHKGEQTRLGRGLVKTSFLEVQAIVDTVRVVERFAAQAKQEGAASVRVLATSAAREASNGKELTAAVKAVGLDLEIIDGITEASLVLQGVRTKPGLTGKPMTVVDVGGGSTEIIVAAEESWRLRQSFPLGTVRWLETHPVSKTPTVEERAKVIDAVNAFFDSQILPCLKVVEPWPRLLVGAGGTPVFLARMLEARDDLTSHEIEARSISLPELESLGQRLWEMSLAKRQDLPGLPAHRADVILFGIAIYEAMMRRCGFDALRPTLRGVRYGALLA